MTKQEILMFDSSADKDFIAPCVLELVCTAYDLRPFAEDMGYHGEPFRWDGFRRAQLRADLDAYYARLYDLTRDEQHCMPYVVNLKEVHGKSDVPVNSLIRYIDCWHKT